jgi:hypothetical protein
MSATMHDDERTMLRDSLRRLLAETDAGKVPAALDDFGWTDLLVSDPGEAIAALFFVQGETLTATPALNAVMAQPLIGLAGSDGEWQTVALPGPGPGLFAVAPGMSPGLCLLRRGEDDATVLVTASPTVRPVQGIDPGLGLVGLDFTDSPMEVLVEGREVGTALEASVAMGRVALACELVGVSRAMLALGVEHAQERRQFGQPIAKFQAVKHRLAEAKVALTAAEAAIDEALVEPGPLTALLAKLWAGRAARMAAKQVQQVLGGMGFTWEHPFHRHLRRTLALDGLLGSAAELQHDLGRTLLATGDVPRLARLER